ncbi:MAG: Flp pilus assembly complex ATPase component TadA [Alphaproteobacteria bacterium]|nr:Flp pilus assembly complex ATPase component TadA [Alphaproteobacteria bacterium]MBN2779571.1 Flp pilus assembly complex ATPase component TadA [Alphaproteobacteria bacterium]
MKIPSSEAIAAKDVDNTLEKKDVTPPETSTPSSVDPWKGLDEKDILSRLFSNNNKLLSDEGETLSVSRDTRNLLAYFSDGSFVVSQSNRYDGRVLSFESLVRQRGLPLKKPIYTSLGILNGIYKENAKKRDSNVPFGDDFNNEIQKDYVDIIANASEKGVSDVHVIVGETTRVFFRIDGTMQKTYEYDSQWGEAFVRSVFASADISDSNYAQNEFQSAQKLGETPLRGSKDLYLPSSVLAIRLQFNPIAFGSQYLVMRLLYANKETDLALESKGATKYETDRFNRMRHFSTGLCVIAGPTGSGKSTTLAGNMNLLLQENHYEINLITVEDPPEYPIDGAQQMPVTNTQNEEEKDKAFTAALAAALRSDPDAMMVGEIRTLSAAQLTFKGALSGHNVWTTLHANTAPAILTRLQDMGVEEFKLRDASLIKGLISQRLFKKLCPECRKKLSENKDNPIHDRLLEAYGQEAVDLAYIKGEGCKACGGKAIVGRVGAFEVILPDTEFLTIMLEGRTKDAVSYWINHLHGRTLREAAVEKMLQGIIGIDEIERWCGFINEPDVY